MDEWEEWDQDGCVLALVVLAFVVIWALSGVLVLARWLW